MTKILAFEPPISNRWAVEIQSPSGLPAQAKYGTQAHGKVRLIRTEKKMLQGWCEDHSQPIVVRRSPR